MGEDRKGGETRRGEGRKERINGEGAQKQKKGEKRGRGKGLEKIEKEGI